MMRRTIAPPPTDPNMKRMINFYDENNAQRWGAVEKETRHSFIVSNVVGEQFKVSKENVISEKEGDWILSKP